MGSQQSGEMSKKERNPVNRESGKGNYRIRND